jgi:hypothetical protein
MSSARSISLRANAVTTSRGAIFGPRLTGYSILILICSTALSHSDCQAKTAVDMIRGPMDRQRDHVRIACADVIARTDLCKEGPNI